MTTENRKEKASWVKNYSSPGNPSFQMLSDVDADKLLHRSTETSPSIGVVRNSGYAQGMPSWTAHGENSIDYWMDGHDTLLFTDAEPFIIAVAVPSRIFPLLPSPAVTSFLLTEFSIPSSQACEKKCLLAIEWSAKLSGKIWQIVRRWPDHKPLVASIGDGPTSNLVHLSRLIYTVPSFCFDCRLKQTHIGSASRIRAASTCCSFSASPVQF